MAFPAVVADEEALPLKPAGADLIVSLLSLHLTNDTPGTLLQIRRALKPDGLFLGAMAGENTLAELRECLLVAESEIFGGAAPRVAPFADVRDAGGLLQRAGFTLPVTDIESYTVRYDSAFALMRDLRAMGMQNALTGRSRRPLTRHFFRGSQRSMRTASATPMAGSERHSRSSGCPAGPRTNRSRSR